MSIVNKKVNLYDGLSETKNKSDAETKTTDKPTSTEEEIATKASRVSKLREMFLTGTFCPVEELDLDGESLTDDQKRVLRSCPGSPPLLSLRSRFLEADPPSSASSKKLPNGSAPPKRPPKPKDLLLKSGLTPMHLIPSMRSRISPRLWKTVAVFESGAPAGPEKRKPKAPTSIPKVVVEKSPEPVSSSATPKSPPVIQPRLTSPAKAVSPIIAPRPTPSPPVAPVALTPLQRAAQLLTEDIPDEKPASPKEAVVSEPSPISPQSSALDESDLQHVEPIAVATADESESPSPKHEATPLTFAEVEKIEVPPNLHVVEVDPLGVHILEDGNFFYAVPGMSDHPSTPADLNVASPPKSEWVDRSAVSDTSHSRLDDSAWKHVRFSSEPILIFSTHSTEEYDRKNEEIDPLSASAAYELEKRLESMELIEVDLKKTEQGLGLSIVGVGLDLDGGEKLGIFVKALNPGGAAELSGKIEPNDQIVEVNGTNLVGVTYEFAAQTLRGTGEVVHFVVGRSADQSSLWMLNEPPENEEQYEEEQEEGVEATNSPNNESVIAGSIPHEDSYETLHKMLMNADEALRDLSTQHTTITEMDSTDFSITNNPIFNNDSFSSDAYTCSPNKRTPESGPRSVLKGTATAASTKRRRDAITHLIQMAADKSIPSTDPDKRNPVTWFLAEQLYDCQTQLHKLHAQVQTLEQQLTAQEAAADEAIERLCLQCRHLELELSEAESHLIVNCRQSSDDGHARASSNCRSPLLLNGSVASDVGTRLPPLGFTAQCASSKLGTRHVHASSDGGDPTEAPLPCLSESSSPHDPLTTTETFRCTAEEARHRIRLISSGGLAGRRPRSRIEIHPPPFTVEGLGGAAAPDLTNKENPFDTFNAPTLPTEPVPNGDPALRPDNTHGRSPPRRPHPILGVELPGLASGSAAHVRLRHRATSSEPSTRSQSPP